MWREIGIFCTPFVLWYFCYFVEADNLSTQCFVASSSSLLSFLLWLYSRHLADIYQRERKSRKKARQQYLMGSVTSREDAIKGTQCRGTVNDHTLHRSVARISPVLSSLFGITLATISAVLYLRIFITISITSS